MPRVPLQPWRPEVRAVNAGYTADALNVVPRLDGFAPFPSGQQATVALPGVACGAATLFTDAGAAVTFAGAPSGLYRAGSGSPLATWSDVSGAAYACDAVQRWQFAAFGQTAIAVNANNAPQAIDLNAAGGVFGNLGGGPPASQFVRTLADFVVLGNTSTNARLVQWSGLNDCTQWTPGINSSDYQELPDGGPIRGLAGTESGLIFQQSAIRRMNFTPGSPEIWQIDKLASDRGCEAPYSIVESGGLVFFLSRDGFWSVADGQLSSISAGKIDEWWRDNSTAAKRSFIEGAIDPLRRRVYWGYWSPGGSSAHMDRVLCYDWALGEWSRAEVDVRCLVSAFVQPSVSLEGLDAYGSLESLPYSLDSAYWINGQQTAAYIAPDNALRVLSGPPLAATIETGDFQPIDRRRAFATGAVLDIDTAASTFEVSARERLPDTLAWQPANGIEDDGHHAAHAEGRYFRGRIRVPAGTAWSAATAIDPMVQPAGSR